MKINATEQRFGHVERFSFAIHHIYIIKSNFIQLQHAVQWSEGRLAKKSDMRLTQPKQVEQYRFDTVSECMFIEICIILLNSLVILCE